MLGGKNEVIPIIVSVFNILPGLSVTKEEGALMI